MTDPAPAFKHGETIRAKWTMDGAETLEQAAERLEKLATDLRRAHATGWTLAGAIDNDYGTVLAPGKTVDDLDE